MLRVNPFAALRPRPGLAAEIAAVPYDVVNTEEARRLAAGNPRSFLHVSRSEIDLPDSTDPYSPVVYERAAQNFQALTREAFLREDAPSIYLYRQEMDLLGKRMSQLGVVTCCHVDDYNADIIKRHEKTRRDKEDDRTRHVLALRANAGPVFLMFRDRPSLASLLVRDSEREPLYDFVALDGVRHTVWRAPAAEPYVREFAATECAYVADGHHRIASAARAAAELRAKDEQRTGDREYDWFLSVLFPASQLSILPYHRVLLELNGLTPARLLERLRQVATVTEASEPSPRAPGSFGMYLEGRWYQVALDPASIDQSSPIGSLDYSLLSERVLGPIFGIEDIRSDQRIDFVGGIRGTGELERRVSSGKAKVAFAMRPTSIEQLFRVADAGEIMPPKSTWFEPKLRSGLLVHTFD
jgi:uncharacterized protein (DUF1015 family)